MNKYIKRAKNVKLEKFDKVLNQYRKDEIIEYSDKVILRKAFFHCMDGEEFEAEDLLNEADTHVRETFCDIIDKASK